MGIMRSQPFMKSHFHFVIIVEYSKIETCMIVLAYFVKNNDT
jgi:hypothetical protein